MRRRVIGILLGLTAVWPAWLAGQQASRIEAEPAPPAGRTAYVIQAARASGGGPVVDGRLDDEVWGRAEPVTDFVQYVPRSGAPATERTEARVLYDDGAIYVGMRLYDRDPAGIAAQLGRRDATEIYSDWAHVVIDSYNDRRTAFRFSVNPRGVQKDVLHYDDTNEDIGWDAVWEVATSVDSLGWTAEFRIPLSQLRFNETDGAEGAVWGINLGRVVARREEHSYWAPVLQEESGFVSRSGELRGLAGLSSPSRLEVMPYVLGRATRAPGSATDPFYEANELFGSLGADLKYGVTSNLTLTAALNPDFGQVESDPSQVNLTAYETFYDERRPFFTEGADIFRFRLSFGDGDGANEQLFYSRRIGRAPQGGLPDEAEFGESPEVATILGAAKLSGKTASGWSVGVLNAVTAEERATTASALGDRGEVVVEPLTNYAVTRVSKDYRDGEGTFGAVLTAMHRRLEGTGLDFLRGAAYTGGADFRHRFAQGKYEVTGKLLGSYIRGSAEAIARVQEAAGHYFQRPDADHLEYDPTRTSLAGAAAMASFGKYGGGNWRWSVGGTARSPGFEVNDLGYQREADVMEQFVWVGYRRYTPGTVFRRWNLNFNQWTGWSFGGERRSTGGNVNGSFQLLSYWGGYAGINRNQSALSVGALRGGPAIVRPGATNFWFGFYSDNRRPLGLGVNGFGYVEDETDGSSFSVGPSIRMRPSSRVELSLGPRMSWNTSAWQYVTRTDAGAGAHYVFARLEQRTASLTTRLSYAFTPALSLQLYAQPFVAAGDYAGFMEVADPRADGFDARFRRYGAPAACPGAGAAGTICDHTDPDGNRQYRVDLDDDQAADFSFADPDFNFKELRSNLVLRWEYRPGSTLFLVWSQGRSHYEPTGAFDLGHDLDRLLGAAGTNVLMIKASYWFNG